METTVIGGCWFDESIESIVLFVSAIRKISNLSNRHFIVVIFDANHTRLPAERASLIESTQCVLLSNKKEYYPNKNFGVASIVEFAKIVNANHVAVIDPDWITENYNLMLAKLLLPLFNDKQDIIIPDITPDAGRDNFLVGQSIINNLYPDLSHIIHTPFPGAVAGKTSHLHRIVNDSQYHYDWGGEWDIIKISYEMGFKLYSPRIRKGGRRHRSSYSKACDAFQMWRAALSNISLDQNYLNKPYYICERNISKEYNISIEHLLTGSATNQFEKLLHMHSRKNLNIDTLNLVSMIVAPLAFLVDGNQIDFPEAYSRIQLNKPYNRKTLYSFSKLATFSAREALMNAETQRISTSGLLERLTHPLLGNWTQERQIEAFESIKKTIKF